MLYKYNLKDDSFSSLEEVDFKSLKIMERQNIEKWVEERPDLMGEELLIITTEYAKFDKTKERLDVLALDKQGKLVVVELKRDDSGRNVELQAIKYAAYCSTLTLEDIILERKLYLNKDGKDRADQEVSLEIETFIENESFEEIDDKPRIIIISKEFRPEVMASVLWLRNFQIDISCIKLTPYRINDHEIGISSYKIIPLPEAEDYQIRVERKESGGRHLSRTGKMYTELWTELKTEIENKLKITISSPPASRYYAVPVGQGGIHLEWIFNKGEGQFGVEIHFERELKTENLHNLNLLKEYLPELEKKLNCKLTIFEDWGPRWMRIRCALNQNHIDDNLKQFAVEKMVLMYKFLQPLIVKHKNDFK